jgi:probable F420-dependent oxidoreductase
MRVLTPLPQDDLHDTGAAAVAAEAAGYDGVVTMENRHEPFLALGVAAVATTRVELHTGIAIAFARSPMAVANAAWDLQRTSRGRFVLGLGSQIRAHNERRFSVPWSAPAPRLREYVEALRAIWRAWQTGAKLDYRGQHYHFTLMTPNFTPPSTGQSMVPVTIAAVGPAMLRLAGELCDGVRLHPFCTRRYVDEVVLPQLRAGMTRSGRAREHFEISGGGFVATGPDDAAVASMVEWVRARVAFYGSTPAYWPVLEVHGLSDLGRKLNVMSKAGQWEQMTAEISDDVVRLFAAVGTHGRIVREIEHRFGGAADAVAISGGYGMHQDVPPDVVRGIQQIPSAFAGYRAPW